MRKKGWLLGAPVIAAACLAACGDSDGAAGAKRETPRIEVAGMQITPDEVLLRSPLLPVFSGGGSPPPPEPIAGLDAAISKAFPEQTRGSSHPWECTVLEVLTPIDTKLSLTLDDVGTWTRPPGTAPAPTPLLEEPLDVAAKERMVVAFGVRHPARVGTGDSPAPPALRWVVVRSAPRAADGAWVVVSSTQGSKDLSASAVVPGENELSQLDMAGTMVGDHLSISRKAFPYVIGVYAWLPPPVGRGRGWSTHPEGKVAFTLDGEAYRPEAWAHPLWRLSLSLRAR